MDTLYGFLRPSVACLHVDGADGLDFLQRMGGQDLTPLIEGKARQLPAVFTDAQGRLLAWVWVLTCAKHSQRVRLVGSKSSLEVLQQALEHFVVLDDVVLTMATTPCRWHWVWQAQSHDAEISLPAGADRHIWPSWGDAFQNSEGQSHEGQNRKGNSFEVFEEGDAALDGALGYQPIGADAFVSMQMKAGIAEAMWEASLRDAALSSGAGDMGIVAVERPQPLELGLGKVGLSFSKGCFVGQEVLSRLDALDKLKRRLIGFSWHGDAAQSEILRAALSDSDDAAAMGWKALRLMTIPTDGVAKRAFGRLAMWRWRSDPEPCFEGLAWLEISAKAQDAAALRCGLGMRGESAPVLGRLKLDERSFWL